MQLLNLLVLAFVGSAIAIPGPPQKNELNGFEKRVCVLLYGRQTVTLSNSIICRHVFRNFIAVVTFQANAALPTRVHRAAALEDLENEHVC